MCERRYVEPLSVSCVAIKLYTFPISIQSCTYLGLLLGEYLDYNVVNTVAQSAGRELGLLIAKCKEIGGVTYNVYTQLYDNTVRSIIAYGDSVCGSRSYSCINAVQRRAMPFFLDIGKNTPTNALYGEFARHLPHVKQLKYIAQLCIQLF